MPFDSTFFSSGNALIQKLESHNRWWELGSEGSVSEEYSSLRSEFQRSYEALHEQESRLISVAGIGGTGKSSLLKQLISAHIDPEFIEKFIRDPDLRGKARENTVPPSNVLYIPLNSDPVFQIRPTEQLRAAVDHFETHVFQKPRSSTHYIFIDDLYAIDRPSSRGEQNCCVWEDILAELLEDEEGRQMVVSSFSGAKEQIEKAQEGEIQGQATENIDFYPIGFPDFLRMRHRELELAPTAEKFHGDKAQDALSEAVAEKDPKKLVSELEKQRTDTVLDSSTVRREIANYCTSGGTVTLRIAGNHASVDSDHFVEVIQGRGKSELGEIQQRAVDEFREELFRAGTKIGGLDDPAGLERLCALAAYSRPMDDVHFEEVTDILEVDRRTLRNKHLSVLSRLHVLSAAQEYDNQRPRNLRFYLRDPGITNAVCRNNLNDILRRKPRLDEELSKAVAFDHTVRLSNRLNHPDDPKRGVVKFWRGSDGSVDFIPKINGRPVPILWSYNRGIDELQKSTDTPGFDALKEFLRRDIYETERDKVDEVMYRPVSSAFADRRREYVQQDRYAGSLSEDGKAALDGEPVFGVVLTNDRSASVELTNDSQPVIQVPLWTYLRISR